MTTPGHPDTDAHRARRAPNALASCHSPYLLQHAHNPVDWRPWGTEAFEEARRRDVAVFLSIGYSTCYWCHVMERESFEDEATARLMNQHFVCVKLDREERPDLDELYMAATILMRGHGGWPMSVFLEPDTLRPFWCGTYFPKHAHAGGASFTQVLHGMSRAFRDQREDVRAQASQLAGAVAESLAARSAGAALDLGTVHEALSRLLAMHDATHGGFGNAPKFPQAVFLEFLLDAREAADDATRAAIDRCVRTTLSAMARGGIHDHLGGGFHRYSVDATWTVPHFEKMLYDQAQLLSVYARGASVYRHEWFSRVAGSIATYVLRDMTTPEGLFASAEDAEVDGREGLNYLWTPEEALDTLTRAGLDAASTSLVMQSLGLHGEANFQDPHHRDQPARWVLRMSEEPGDGASRAALDRGLAAMVAARDARARPHRDDKAITSWNAMMCAALIEAGEHLGQAAITTSGLDALDRLARVQLRADGSLARCRRNGVSYGEGVLEDYAAMIHACVAASRVGQREAWLARAGAVLERSRTLFFGEGGGSDASEHSVEIFDTSGERSDVFVRACATHDGAVPSGFSMMLWAMLDLADATREHASDGDARAQALRGRVLAALAAQSGRIDESPAGTSGSVRALLRLLRRGLRVPTDSRAQPARQPQSRDGEAPQDCVQIYASADRIAIAREAPAETTIAVHVAPGFHVISANPGDDAPALVPFRIDVIHGSGVAAYADYPAGTLLAKDGPLAGVRGYEGTFEVRVVLERDGEWRGTPLLGVRFQACGPDACYLPRVVELDIALDRA